MNANPHLEPADRFILMVRNVFKSVPPVVSAIKGRSFASIGNVELKPYYPVGIPVFERIFAVVQLVFVRVRQHIQLRASGDGEEAAEVKPQQYGNAEIV